MPVENAAKFSTKSININRLSLYVALCMFMSGLEFLIPKPIPFLRIGLANLPVMLAIKKSSFGECSLLVFLKIICQGLISGTLFSYVGLFSFTGSFFAFFAMFASYKIFGEKISNIGIGIAGAFFNNAGQLLCGYFVMFGQNILYIAPFLFISGFLTSTALGIFCNIFEKKSLWINESSVENFWDFEIDLKKDDKNFWSNFLFIASMLMLIAFVFIKSILAQWIVILVVFVALEFKKRGKVKILPTLFIVLFMVLFGIFYPQGKVLFSLGKLKVTLGALEKSLHKAGILVGMVFISQLGISRNVNLPGSAGQFIKRIFYFFDRLIAFRKRIDRKKNIVATIDEILLDVCK